MDDARSKQQTHMPIFFPFPVHFISKDSIPWPATHGQDYESLSCPNGPGPLQNCCWLEATFHVLLRDPCLRFFVQQALLKPLDLFLGSQHLRGATDADKRQYELGCLVMEILAERLNNKATVRMPVLYARYRSIVSGNAVSPVDWNRMGLSALGNAAASIMEARNSIAFFLAVNFSGNIFQLQYEAYGSKPLIQIRRQCLNKNCPGANIQSLYNGGGDEVTLQQLDALNVPGIKIILESAARTSLDQIVKTWGESKWKIMNKTCNLCASIQIAQKRWMTLPWTLCFEVNRLPPSLDLQVLTYNPDELLVGPTADGQYATYKMISRVNFKSSHFTVDIRAIDDNWKNWSFQSIRANRLRGTVEDTFSGYMVWERVG